MRLIIPPKAPHSPPWSLHMDPAVHVVHFSPCYRCLNSTGPELLTKQRLVADEQNRTGLDFLAKGRTIGNKQRYFGFVLVAKLTDKRRLAAVVLLARWSSAADY